VSEVEVYLKWQLQGDTLPSFLEEAERIVAAASLFDPARRCDWFVNDAKREVIALLVFADAGSFAAHLTAARASYAALRAAADLESCFLGRVEHAARAALGDVGSCVPHLVQFEYGLAAVSAAGRFRPLQSAPATQHIEIFTRFDVQPGRLAQFRALAREITDIVRERDPGTPRYDWLYDEASHFAVALDTYADTPSMFAHIRNCHVPHDELTKISTMSVEFLGDLPPEARKTIAKFNPYLTRFVAGLRPWSSCAFA
jgi:quinol monooxygenase YgiN